MLADRTTVRPSSRRLMRDWGLAPNAAMMAVWTDSSLGFWA